MAKFLIVFILILSSHSGSAQEDLHQYLATHHYSFFLDKGFDETTAQILKQKIGNYKLVLQAEGGSHYLHFYGQLQFLWLQFLSKNFGLTHFFGESGHSSDMLLNKYLDTGDTSYIFVADKTFWRSLYHFNSSLPSDKQLRYFGIDFESRRTYIKGLKLILPALESPPNIKPFIDLIKNADDTISDCDYIININSNLRKAFIHNANTFSEYLREYYSDFEKIVLNKGNCKDVYKDRNNNMATNFLSFDKDFKNNMYYGELGEAHTVLLNKNTASIINGYSDFKDKVCVINLYCYNCTTLQETPSNWPLNKIEKDILTYLLPYCLSDFTLFDLSDSPEISKKYGQYGQFLIIAKNQN